jgi:hypothetical protein
MFTCAELPGFAGGIAIASLVNGCDALPDVPGVYAVVAPTKDQPAFLEVGTGGRFKGRNPNAPIQELARRWCPTSSILYIGKAARLRQRVRQYIRFGLGQAAAHWGGRYIWQLACTQALTLFWRLTPLEAPAHVERQMLAEFRSRHGQLPFANLRAGSDAQPSVAADAPQAARR